MSFKDFIKNNVVDFGDEKKVPPQSAILVHKDVLGSDYQEPERPTKVVFRQAGYTYSPKDIEATNAFRQHFLDLMEKSNLPGPDYFEFVQAKDKMAANISDEAVCYQTAFSVLSGMGLSKELINSSAQKYIAIVTQEMKDFNATFEDTYKHAVDDNNAAIAAKQDQVKKLQDEINALQAEVQKGDALKDKRNAFNAAGQNMNGTIAAEVQKVNNYIK